MAADLPIGDKLIYLYCCFVTYHRNVDTRMVGDCLDDTDFISYITHKKCINSHFVCCSQMLRSVTLSLVNVNGLVVLCLPGSCPSLQRQVLHAHGQARGQIC